MRGDVEGPRNAIDPDAAVDDASAGANLTPQGFGGGGVVSSLAFGGGGHFGLYFDQSFEYGSSQESATFDNDCLASTPQFKIIKVEVWGFVHEGRDCSGAIRES